MKTDWIPKEHGAWGMIGGSFLSVVAVHGGVTLAMGVFLLGFLCLYFTRVPFLNIFRKKATHRTFGLIALFGSLGWGFIIAAAILRQYPMFPLWVMGLVPFFLVELVFVRHRKPNHFIPQLVGTVGLSAIAALTDALWHGSMTFHGLWLWGINSAFFVAGITIVRQQIAARAPRANGRGYLNALRISTALYLFMPVVWLTFPMALLKLAWLVLVPVMAEVALFSTNRFLIQNLKILGWLQIAQTLIFVLLLAILQ